MAKVIVTSAQDWRKICELAGGDTSLIMHDPATNELEVTDVTQAALDTALASYVADQTNIDQVKVDAEIVVAKDKEKDALDMRRVLKAILGGIVGEINLLRDEHALPTRTDAQVRTAIRNLIDAG